jgi:hypothetical protein
VDPPELRRERELKLQAAIVRIMKARRVIDHSNLIAEATTQVVKWFTPKVPVIKKVQRCGVTALCVSHSFAAGDRVLDRAGIHEAIRRRQDD